MPNCEELRSKPEAPRKSRHRCECHPYEGSQRIEGLQATSPDVVVRSACGNVHGFGDDRSSFIGREGRQFLEAGLKIRMKVSKARIFDCVSGVTSCKGATGGAAMDCNQ